MSHVTRVLLPSNTAKRALLMSCTGNHDSSVILTNPLSGDFDFGGGIRVSAEFLHRRFFGAGELRSTIASIFSAMGIVLAVAVARPRRPQRDHLAPRAEGGGDVDFSTRGPKVASIPFYTSHGLR